VGFLSVRANWHRRSCAAACYSSKPRLARPAFLIAGFLLVGLAAWPAGAQVMEISPDGTVLVRRGSGAATWQTVNQPAEDQSVEIQVPAGALTIVDQTQIPSRYSAAVHSAAAAAGISDALLAALVWQESRWNEAAVSAKGAVGLAQLMPDTARDLGVDPRDPAANLAGGARYLRQLLNSFDGNVEEALAAYNAGPARVERANGVPAIAETRAYVSSVVQHVSSQIER
jgi:soluble lytic murein transglycosylase-like protein